MSEKVRVTLELCCCLPFVGGKQEDNCEHQEESVENVKEDASLNKEFPRLKEQLRDASFVGQIGLWHLMKQRKRDARQGSMKESGSVVRKCKAKTEKINQGDWEKPQRRIMRYEWGVCRDVANNETIWQRCAVFFFFKNATEKTLMLRYSKE